MKRVLQGIYYFLPVQLLLLHFRKYQLLLFFLAYPPAYHYRKFRFALRGVLIIPCTGIYGEH